MNELPAGVINSGAISSVVYMVVVVMVHVSRAVCQVTGCTLDVDPASYHITNGLAISKTRMAVFLYIRACSITMQ